MVKLTIKFVTEELRDEFANRLYWRNGFHKMLYTHMDPTPPLTLDTDRRELIMPEGRKNKPTPILKRKPEAYEESVRALEYVCGVKAGKEITLDNILKACSSHGYSLKL